MSKSQENDKVEAISLCSIKASEDTIVDVSVVEESEKCLQSSIENQDTGKTNNLYVQEF